MPVSHGWSTHVPSSLGVSGSGHVVRACAPTPDRRPIPATSRRPGRRCCSRSPSPARLTRSAAFTSAVSTCAAERPRDEDLTLAATALMIGTSTTAISVIVTITSMRLNPRSRPARVRPLPTSSRDIASATVPPWPPSLSAQQIPRVRGTSIRLRQVSRRVRYTRAIWLTRGVAAEDFETVSLQSARAEAPNAAADRPAVSRDGDEPRCRATLRPGPRRDPSRGRSAGDGRARLGGRRGSWRARSVARLHECARAADAPTPFGGALPRTARRRDRSRARAHRGGRVGRLHARVPCCVRARRASRRHRARLPVLPQHPDRARHGAGADRRRSRDPMGADARPARGGWAPRRARRRLPVEPDRHRARRERARAARAPLR